MKSKASVKKTEELVGTSDKRHKEKMSDIPEKLKKTLEIGGRVFEQERGSKGKIYSLHEPQVECLSKGKSHKEEVFDRASDRTYETGA